MRELIRSFVVTICLVLASCASAQDRTDPALTLSTPHTATPNSSGMSVESLTLWGLTGEEIQLVMDIIPIERAFSNVDALTPFELLGKYAKTPVERKNYAQRFVEANLLHQRRSLEWAVEVSRVANSTDYGQMLMASDVIAGYLQDNNFKGYVNGLKTADTGVRAERRLHVFVSTGVCGQCGVLFKQSLDAVSNGEAKGVDVVFVDMEAEDQKVATEWAVANGITAEMISSRVVTLNYDTPAWRKERKPHSVPLVIDTWTGDPVE